MPPKGAIELLRILMVGDVVGRPGREAVTQLLPDLLDELEVDFTVVNGENAAQGAGITKPMAIELFEAGADCVTLGNHTWARREIGKFLDLEPRLIRPANYPPGAPGVGLFRGHARGGRPVAVLNLMGRVYMPNFLDCPFRVGDEILQSLPAGTTVLVDFHAEATSEKI
ncbi:metallophosphoesterase, partial [bacterium CPR1]|nr:metallophosphoesterase [bacterium CPR1]